MQYLVEGRNFLLDEPELPPVKSQVVVHTILDFIFSVVMFLSCKIRPENSTNIWALKSVK
jgi:hypothetical protein